MKSIKNLFFLILMLLFANAVNAADLNSTPNLKIEMSKFDKLFAYRHQPEKLETSIKILENLVKYYPENGDIYWKLAQAYTGLGDYTAQSDKELLKRYEFATKYGEKAEQIASKNAESYLWSATLLGQAALIRGILDSLFAAKPMEIKLLKAVKLDPNYGFAHYVLARLYREAPGFISIGDIDKAKKHIDIALSLGYDPRYPIEYAKVYVAINKKADAIKMLEDFLQRSVKDPDSLDAFDYKREQKFAKDYLDKIKK